MPGFDPNNPSGIDFRSGWSQPGYMSLAGSNLAPPKGANGASVGAGLAGELINVGANLYTQWRNREFQREMLAGEQDFTREMWNANNAYNTPLSQVNRLKLAGLNPSLMYGSMSDAGNSTLAGSPGGAAPNQVAPHVDPLLMAEIDKLRAETEAIEHTTQREDEKQPYTIENMTADIDSKNSAIAVNAALISKMSVEEQLMYSNITRMVVQNWNETRKTTAEVDHLNKVMEQLDAQIKLTDEEYNQLVAFKTLREENIRATNAELWSRVGVANAEVTRLQKAADLLDSQKLTEDERRKYEYDPNYRKAVKDLTIQQKALAKSQEEYWKDYKANPGRYRATVKSDSKSVSGGYGPFSSSYSHSSTTSN